MNELPPILRFVPATPEYVLGVLRDGFCRELGIEHGDPECSFTLDDSSREMSELGEFDWFDVLRTTVKRRFDIRLSLSEWESFVDPASSRTMRDVCTYIAERVQQPRFLPAHLVGPACRPAGAFLAIRQLMENAGEDVSNLAPSTPVQAYAGSVSFDRAIGVLAPGVLPAITYRSIHGFFHLGCAGTLIATLLFVVGLTFLAARTGLEGLGLTLMGAVVPLFFGGVALLRLDHALTPDDDLSFGGLRTFRDLAVFIAEQDEQSEQCNAATTC